MRGEPGGERAVHTREDVRQLPAVRHLPHEPAQRRPPRHPVLGARRPGDGVYKTNIQFQPPHGAMWDYFVNDDNIGETRIVKRRAHRRDLAPHRDPRQLRYGHHARRRQRPEVTTYQSPDPANAAARGPIGMQRHGKGVSEYKEIWIEADPDDDRLLSVHGT